MNNDIIENVVEQNKIHREIGYLEGLSDAYRDLSLKHGANLSTLEQELRALLVKFNPPF